MVAVLPLREIDRGFRVTVGSKQTLKLVHVFTASQVGLKSKDSTFACTYSYCDWILITPTYNRRCSIIAYRDSETTIYLSQGEHGNHMDYTTNTVASISDDNREVQHN
jgi:hypothetical protein